jgi:LPS-assembly lipoprotein
MHRRTLLAALALPLAGCGFELRRAPTLPFRSIALTGFAPRSPLAEEMKRALEQSVQVLDVPARAEAVLQALTDAHERSVVGSSAAGQVRDVQLRVRFRYRVATPAGRELLLADELLLTRDMSYNETSALAKEQEETQLFRAMDADIVTQVMRRLAVLKKAV